jgi:hypothetical protein
MRWLLLPLALLALGALGLAFRGGGDGDAATATSEAETKTAVEPGVGPGLERSVGPGALKSCGGLRVYKGYHRIKVEVVEGDVPCRVARRVIMGAYDARGARFWTCHGPEGLFECRRSGRPSGQRIRARFYCRDWGQEQARCREMFGPH